MKPNLLLSELSRQLKMKHFTGKGDYVTVDRLLQGFQSKIKESLKEARRDAWSREYQADPKSESYQNARKKSAGSRKAREEIVKTKARFEQQRYREEVEEEAKLTEIRERARNLAKEFEAQGVRPEEIELDLRARDQLKTTVQTL